MKKFSPGHFVVGIFVILLVSCDKTATSSRAQQSAPVVQVVIAQAESVPVVHKLVGRLAPFRAAQVRARVSGIILKRVYKEGSDVKKGQVLFQIDPAPLQASLHASEAALAKAKADAFNAALGAKRNRALSAKGLVATQDLDTALANERTTLAIVKVAEANVEKARLDLGYATVVAPINGYAGRAMVTEGALVGEGEATQLTSIDQIDPVYVNFSQSVNNLQQFHQMEGTTPALQNKPNNRVKVILADNTVYPYTGSVDFSDLAVDPNTGMVSLRAVVPNKERRLLPGMFIKLRVTQGQLDHAFLLPQATVLRDDAGAYVFVVNKADKVEQRRVKSHGMSGTDWILTGKLKNGDKVISDGLQKVRPGVMVKITTAVADKKRITDDTAKK